MKTSVDELTVGTFDVRTPAFSGKIGLGNAEETIEVCQQNGCDIVGFAADTPGRPKQVHKSRVCNMLQCIWPRRD